MPVNLHFDFLAGFYERLIPPADPAEFVRLLALPCAGPLLDVGGGTGRVSARLASFVSRVVVCDLSLPMLRQARRHDGLAVVQARGHRLPFTHRAFQRILVVDAVHHFQHPDRVLAELMRVLAPGGRLVIEEPDIRRWPVRLVALAERLALMDSHFLPPAQIATLLEALGTRPRLQDDGRWRSWIIVDKPPAGK
ncbi:MAG: class I SAM-dependent methyltransferase [Desulfobacterales bacterium]|jgi:demethylmenaquinone methyltransferase/2-methoxy-6-polyprenyl-1,4-benzoquinol methylase|nr:class I SAM-dependent methyltransferase [Desulfobacterales bacterium]